MFHMFQKHHDLCLHRLENCFETSFDKKEKYSTYFVSITILLPSTRRLLQTFLCQKGKYSTCFESITILLSLTGRLIRAFFSPKIKIFHMLRKHHHPASIDQTIASNLVQSKRKKYSTYFRSITILLPSTRRLEPSFFKNEKY